MTLNYCIKKGREALIHSVSKPASFHYAVVTDARGRVIGESENKAFKSHPTQARYAAKAMLPDKVNLHAELHAIIRAAKNGKPHTIYVCRIGKKGNVLYSEPCIICKMMIKDAGIKVVTYTTGE